MLRRRALLRTASAALATPAIAAPASVLSFVPQANLNSIDPIWTTATVTRNFGLMVFEMLFGRETRRAFAHEFCALVARQRCRGPLGAHRPWPRGGRPQAAARPAPYGSAAT